MEGLFLTIALSIVIPLLILLIWFFVIFILVKKCVFNKRHPSENGDTVPCRFHDCAGETTAISDCPDEPILSNQERSSDVHEHCERGSFADNQTLQLPLYSTLPRNGSRSFSSDCSRDDRRTNSRHGYRLCPGNYSPFSQDTSLNQSETMQALSMYCDRYIADAHYDPPPPYNSRENVREHSQLTRTVSGREAVSLSSAYGCETWI